MFHSSSLYNFYYNLKFFIAAVENKDHAQGDSENGDRPTNVGITDYDYRNGQFSFSEKLIGILRSRVILRYQQLCEIASPPSGADTLEATLIKCRELARLMLDDVEEDRNVYRKAFAKEQIDIL
jgi:hypothetical protein